jgi:CheY-like chemotaxis protein
MRTRRNHSTFCRGKHYNNDDRQWLPRIDMLSPQGGGSMLSATSPEAGGRTNRRRVLVVEDDLDAVQSMAVLIQMMGHDCHFAINGFSAMDIARTFRPDVILLDIGLPDSKGYEIARQLRFDSRLEATRIIALTGLPEADRGRAIEAGCDEFFSKPLDPKVLEDLIGPEYAQAHLQTWIARVEAAVHEAVEHTEDRSKDGVQLMEQVQADIARTNGRLFVALALLEQARRLRKR